MHLIEVLKHRVIPAAGVYLCLTRRCPLYCEHCSTNSHPGINQSPNPEYLIRFVRSFNMEEAPKILFLTGGEPLTLPDLVKMLCKEAQTRGTKVIAITGMFFAKSDNIPKEIWEAIMSLDHLCISIDIFHEKQIERTRIFKTLHKIRNAGIDISIQATGYAADDPYLLRLVDHICKEFNNQVPIFVSSLNAVGRAQNLINIKNKKYLDTLDNTYMDQGCRVVTWPVVTFDGTIVACCNQQVVDGPSPDHLNIGNIKDTNWSLVRNRILENVILRYIRIFGPKQVAKASTNGESCSGYCNTCMSLDKIENLEDKLEARIKIPYMNLLESLIQNHFYSNPINRMPRFSHLLYLGAPLENTIEKGLDK